MEGGRYIASGTYGCVFTPPLLCKSGKQPSQKLVGKITYKKLAEHEAVIGNHLRKMPLVKNYMLLPEPESCKLAAEELQEEPGIAECRKDFEAHQQEFDLGEMKQIVSPFGGTKAFYEIFLNTSLNPKQFDFLKFMGHILEAGSTLLLAKVCHFDLHAGNLLIDRHKTVRILDFGLSFITDSITRDTVTNRWKRLRFGFEPDAAHPSIHNSEAPELTVMNAVRRNEYTVENAIRLTIIGKPVFRDMERHLGISRETSYDELMQFWATSEYARKNNFVELWRTYWPGFDAWSIGSILLETLSALLLLPEFTKGEYKEKKTSVLAALQGLLHPNPRERLDTIEALAVFEPGNPWLNRFGKKWLEARKRQRGEQI